MQPAKNNIKYDVVVLGATLPGVFYAINQKLLGNSVLITNKYGFPGGCLTESLSLYQETELSTLNFMLAEWLSKLKNEQQGILSKTATGVVLNPEAVKISLLQLLLKNDIDMLFHVFPKSVDIRKKMDNVLKFWGKEGEITVSCAYLYDATENFALNSFFEEGYSTAKKYAVNVITTPISLEKLASVDGIQNLIQLSDGRCWCQIPYTAGDPDFYENESQTVIDDIEKKFKKAGCRIQVVPPQSEITNVITLSPFLKNFEEYIGSITMDLASDITPYKTLQLTDTLLKERFNIE